MLHRRVTRMKIARLRSLDSWIIYHGTCLMDKKWSVKVGSATSTQGTREFENELNLLSAIRHENLVPLLLDTIVRMISKFLSILSCPTVLYKIVYTERRSIKKKVLDWPTRISIALGLFYLAHFCRAWSHS
ncbi:hypothetical protein Sjap_006188 [Stephania japonica]|uniref:Uncharacterized protein n=1 Tax=Stephania japonica TaxID=461633 RepID=A0AAP0K6K1_9MAGN